MGVRLNVGLDEITPGLVSWAVTALPRRGNRNGGLSLLRKRGLVCRERQGNTGAQGITIDVTLFHGAGGQAGHAGGRLHHPAGLSTSGVLVREGTCPVDCPSSVCAKERKDSDSYPGGWVALSLLLTAWAIL